MVKEKYLVFCSRELPIFMVSGFFAIIFKMKYFPNQENHIEVYGSTIIVAFIPVFFYYAFQLIGIEFLKLKYPNKNRSNYSTDGNKFKNTTNYISYIINHILYINIFHKSNNTTNIYKNNFVLSKPINKPKTKEKSNKKTLDETQIKAINTINLYSIDILSGYIEGDYLKALYKHIEVLVEGGTNFSNLGSIKVNNLNKQDLYHFGWNIWSYLNNSYEYNITQNNIANFLISLFENLKDSKKETIINNMTKDGGDKIKREADVVTKYNNYDVQS